jgi:hypothetical protein
MLGDAALNMSLDFRQLLIIVVLDRLPPCLATPARLPCPGAVSEMAATSTAKTEREQSVGRQLKGEVLYLGLLASGIAITYRVEHSGHNVLYRKLLGSRWTRLSYSGTC